MILDLLENRRIYSGLAGGLVRALDFLATTDLDSLDHGYHRIEGARLYAIVQEYQTRPRDGCVWEAHRKYCDVQYVARGVECIGHAPLGGMIVTTPYDAEKDVVLLSGEGDLLTLRAGTFMILWPHDAHMPGLALGAPAVARKIVLKVAIE